MPRWADFAAGVTTVALAASVLLPRRNSTAELLATVGKSQAAMMRAMLGPIRCTKEILWPTEKGNWLRRGCSECGDHALHATVDGLVFTDGDIEWWENQYRLTTEGRS